MARTHQTAASDIEAIERREWLESLDYVMEEGGPERVERLLQHLRLGRNPLRGRLQSFFPRQERKRRGRYHFFPGSRFSGDLRAGISGRTAALTPARELSPRAETRRRARVLSPPLADAGLLGIP